MATVHVKVRSTGLTVERIVTRQLGRYVPGVVEATFDLNRGLADAGPILPVGTEFDIPQPTDDQLAAAVDVIRLTD